MMSQLPSLNEWRRLDTTQRWKFILVFCTFSPLYQFHYPKNDDTEEGQKYKYSLNKSHNVYCMKYWSTYKFFHGKVIESDAIDDGKVCKE